MVALLCLYLGLAPARCDLIELNHQPRFSQVIYWRWEPDYGRYDVSECCILRDCDDVPYRTASGWHHHGVVAPLFKETSGIKDPEVENRNLIWDSKRVRLIHQQEPGYYRYPR